MSPDPAKANGGPVCYCGLPMSKRETITHGTCWCCYLCGNWTHQNPPPTYDGLPLYVNMPSIASLGDASHWAEPSPN